MKIICWPAGVPAKAVLLSVLTLSVAAAPAFATSEQATVLAPAEGSLSSSPQESTPHHTPFDGDWAVDIAGAAGRPVHARFSNESGSLGLSVIGTFEPCAAPNGGTAGVGVKVQVSVDGVALGVVNYVHLADVHPVGAIANGDQIGTMASGSSTSCWSGPHVHMEPRNQSKYSCFQGTPLSSSVGASSKLGVLGGEYASGKNQLCPAGAVDPPRPEPSPQQPQQPPQPPQPPQPRMLLKVHRVKQHLGTIRRHGMRLRVRCSETCASAALLVIGRKTARRLGFEHAKGPVLVGAGTAALAPNRYGLLRVKLTREARRRLRGRVRVQLAVIAADATGNKTPLVRRYVLSSGSRSSIRGQR